MSNLYNAWGLTLLIGIGMITFDVVFLPLFEIRGIPALSVIGAAFILLVFTSVLNWTFKEAWEERSRAKPHGQNDDAAG